LGVRRFLGLSLALCAACGSGRDLWLPPPDLGGKSSAVLVASRDGSILGVWVAEVVGGRLGALEVEVEPPEAKLELLAFSGTVEQLGLTTGAQRWGEEGGRLLPDPQLVFSATVGQGAGLWVPQGAPSLSAASLRLPSAPIAGQCVELTLQVVHLTDDARPIEILTAVDSERALFWNDQRQLFIANLDGSVAPFSLAGLSTGAADLQLFLDQRSRIWMVDTTGRVAVGTLAGLAPAPSASFLDGRATSLRVDGTAVPHALTELVVEAHNDEEISLSFFNGASWVELWRTQKAFDSEGVQLAGATEAIAWGHDSRRVVYFDGLRIRAIELPLTAVDIIKGGRYVPAVGPLMFTDLGKVFRVTEDGVLALPGSTLTTVNDLAPLRRGFVFGGFKGRFAQYDGERYCPPETYGSDKQWSRLIPAGDGFFLQPRFNQAPIELGILRPR
jgi:hypothetical protein